MDDFENYLGKNPPLLQEALTDPSYRRYSGNGSCRTNEDLAALGGAVLDLALYSILYGELGGDQLAAAKGRYGSDRVPVTVVARHYGILGILRYDRNDRDKRNGYSWDPVATAATQRFLADAAKAALGAFYLRYNQKMARVVPVVRYWMRLADGRTIGG